MHTLVQDWILNHPNGVVIIRWVTSAGKTSLSLDISQHIASEIISADSRQIYKYMDIGTDKILLDQRAWVPHHQIDIVDPDQIYTAGQRKQDVLPLVTDTQTRGRIPMIVGGTWLYLDTLYKNYAMPEVAPDMVWREDMMQQEQKQPGFLYNALLKIDPQEAQKHHPNSLRYVLRALEICTKTWQTKTSLAHEQPVNRPLLMIGLWRERDDANHRINQRIRHMMDNGLEDEVSNLLTTYWSQAPGMQAIGYKEIVGYLQWLYDRDRAIELLKRNTHHLAKKQRTRFRRYIADSKQCPKDNVTYHHVFY